MNRICMIPNVSGTGGMVSFRNKLESKLREAGIGTCFDLSQEPYQAVLVIGGTRQLTGIQQARRKGIRIVQRLDGINWIHRRKFTGLHHMLRSEIGNVLQSTIRRRQADHIIYQSDFARKWWQDWYGKTSTPSTVIHNGVDLDMYTPTGTHQRPVDRYRVLLVEGNFSGGYEGGLKNAHDLVADLQEKHNLPVELMVVGTVAPELRSRWDQHSNFPVVWVGNVPRDSIPELDRSAHILYAADLHPACPNSVIEALACGLPVAAFNTGAIRELVPEDSGWVAPYGSDPWKLQSPDIQSLSEGVYRVLVNNKPYRQAARKYAKQNFNLDDMTENYLNILMEDAHE